ncbi:VanZ family protein [Thalassotalea sp. PLHSN55]|uniref:VanZ family protein n=1 Tax=Thalassotalea sp. PLHSN55 TaxID=3435888 RepID=UPI003F8488A9
MNYRPYLPLIISLLLSVLLYFSPLLPLLLKIAAIDKLGHFIGFFFLTWLVYLIVDGSLLAMSLCLLLYSGLTELGQHFLGFRNGEMSDFIADALGIAFFVMMQLIFNKFSKKAAA